MRQVLLIALLVVAALANEKNCSTVPIPSATANYYMPPFECVQNDTAIGGCISGFSTCVKGASNCQDVNGCFAARILCLVNTVPVSPNCSDWSSGLDNAGLYLTAGGQYEDSTLQRACEYGACQGAEQAFRQGVKAPNGDVCEVNFEQVCGTAPSFEAPTRSPTQAEFSITFGGAWADVLGSGPVDKTSAKYREVEAGVTKGLAKLFNIPEYLIIITELRVGSLVVKFVLREDPTGQTPAISVEQIQAKLQEVSSNPTLAGSTFTELADASGITITVTEVAVDTPAPTPNPNAPNTTSTPAPDAAGVVSAVVAVAAVFAMLF